MTVKKPMPCSLYDMEGIQNWLDEMARQGLFLDRIAFHNDRFIFRTGEPRAVRYRLDPIVPGYYYNERKELYAQAGWEFADTVTNLYCVYFCADPSVPELYTDPQSLSCAVRGLFRRLLRKNGLFFLVLAFLTACLLFVERKELVRNLLLGERPLQPLVNMLLVVSLVLAGILDGLYLKRLWTVCRTLEQGLPLKAGRRWNRPRYLVWFIPVYVLVSIFSNLATNYSTETLYTYDAALLSHPWPTAAQIEQIDSGQSPDADGYLVKNTSYFAPVQEYVSADCRLPSLGDCWTGVRCVQARSPEIAALIYQLERDKEVRYYEKAPSYPNNNRITELQPFRPWDWPGLDKAELARYHRRGQDVWTVLLLRGTDVLMVEYSGRAQPEDCLPLFLEALDKEVTV